MPLYNIHFVNLKDDSGGTVEQERLCCPFVFCCFILLTTDGSFVVGASWNLDKNHVPRSQVISDSIDLDKFNCKDLNRKLSYKAENFRQLCS